MNKAIFTLIFTMTFVAISAGEGACAKCQMIRKYNAEHPTKPQFYEDYKAEHPEGHEAKTETRQEIEENSDSEKQQSGSIQ